MANIGVIGIVSACVITAVIPTTVSAKVATNVSASVRIVSIVDLDGNTCAKWAAMDDKATAIADLDCQSGLRVTAATRYRVIPPSIFLIARKIVGACKSRLMQIKDRTLSLSPFQKWKAFLNERLVTILKILKRFLSRRQAGKPACRMFKLHQ